MITFDLLIGVILVTISLYLYWTRYHARPRNDLPLPPGPKRLPIIGNLLDMPKGLEWITYHKWCKELNSDIVYLNVAGTPIIILDSAEAAIELLEKRSNIYSNRPKMVMAGELMGWETCNIGLMPYGEKWRKHRRLLHHVFHPKATLQFCPHELKSTHTFLRRLLKSPNDLRKHLHHLAGDTIMSITYGIDVLPENDPYIEAANIASDALVKAAVPGAFLVDAIPILKYIPDWMPFAGFKRQAKEWKKCTVRMIEAPWAATQKFIASGTAVPSFVSTSLQKMQEDTNDDAYEEHIIKTAAGTMYTVGSDTTIAAIASCILGLIDKPAVLKKAQKEIDAHLNMSRLPTFDDEESLPYITAIVKETLRWRDVTPFGVPHLLDVEDVYKGYRIPAGSVIIANSWAMLHDENVYPDPFTFNPDRFMKDGKLDNSVRDPSHACFGFGRRVCPGRFMALSAVWIAIASLIAVFDVSKEVDEQGNVVEPSHESIPGLVAMPKPYGCTIKPRSRVAETLILSTLDSDV